MRSAFITKYGAGEMAVGELPRPTPADLAEGQLLVRPHVVGVNPADVKTREGKIKAIMGKPSPDNPITMGYDLAGEVLAVGPACTGGFSVGDRVAGVGVFGALCEQTKVHEDNFTRIPEGVSYGAAAAVITPGLTALQMLKAAGALKPDEVGAGDQPPRRLFITAGAGGVGHLAIQMAKRVFTFDTVATTASAAKHDFVTGCGADVAIDYTAPGDAGDFTKALRTRGGAGAGEGDWKYDVAMDCMEQYKKCRGVVRPGGVVVSCSFTCFPSGAHMAQLPATYHMPQGIPGCILSCFNGIAACRNCCTKVRTVGTVMLPFGWEMGEVMAMVAAGTVTPTIDRVYALDAAAEAFDYAATGRVIGKVLVEVVPGATASIVQRRPLAA